MSERNPDSGLAGTGNTKPTLESVRGKLERPGALFASDEMRLVVAILDSLYGEVRYSVSRGAADQIVAEATAAARARG